MLNILKGTKINQQEYDKEVFAPHLLYKNTIAVILAVEKYHEDATRKLQNSFNKICDWNESCRIKINKIK